MRLCAERVELRALTVKLIPELRGFKPSHLRFMDELQDKGISAQMVNLILKERLRQAGYDAREYGAHSLRAGFLMEGGKQRMALSDLMAMSGHRTASHAIRYHRAGAAMDNPAALMAG